MMRGILRPPALLLMDPSGSTYPSFDKEVEKLAVCEWNVVLILDPAKRSVTFRYWSRLLCFKSLDSQKERRKWEPDEAFGHAARSPSRVNRKVALPCSCATISPCTCDIKSNHSSFMRQG